MHRGLTSTVLRQCQDLHVMFRRIVSDYSELLELMSLMHDTQY
jgi:hypothetical protein